MFPTDKLKTYDFWRDLTIIGLLALILLLMLSMLLPAPYNIRYAFNRVFFEPTFTCKDGIYSFAKTKQGACSGHGGVR